MEYLKVNRTSITLHILMLMVFVFSIVLILTIIIYYEKRYRRLNNSLNYKIELYNSLCTNIEDAFTIYDCTKHTFEFISPNFEELLGISNEDLRENPLILLNYCPLKNRQECHELLSKLSYKGQKEINLEYRHPITGQNYWLFLRIFPVYQNNKFVRCICSVSDITKEYQAQIDIKEDLINVQKANQAKKDFMSQMSHELKTPINAIIGMTQIASMSIQNTEKLENCLDSINYASRNLLLIINNILDTVKIDSNKLVLSYEPFRLSNELSLLSELFQSQAEIKNLSFRLHLNEINEDYIIGDRLRLDQILGNCISNSLKFTPSGGAITLEVTEVCKNNNKVTYSFELSDTGKGMNEKFLDQIFEPFSQENSTISQKYGGSGLGMTIVKYLVELMGGTIHVISKLDQGTKITLELTFDISSESSISQEIEKMNSNLTKIDCTGMRVLIVEDNDINLEITSEFLKYNNIEVTAVSNGYEAIKIFEASQPEFFNAILMDLQMPGIDGYETTKRIRNSSHPDANSVIIIAVTADDFSNDVLSFLNGMNYHITKPIEAEKISTLLQMIYTKKVGFK